VTKRLLLVLANLERKSRLSSEMQARFATAGLDGWMDLCAETQRELVSSVVGCVEDTREHREWLEMLRTAHLMFPDEPQFREIPIQVKFNRRSVGLPEGFFLDVPLHLVPDSGADARATTLQTVIERGPCVVIAGSIT
jgi:hypothetical protein